MPLRWLMLNIVVAASYALSGRLGLLLAIPPGYATAIFPAAGIALAVVLVLGPRILPGIWLGSFAMNLSIGAAPAAIGDVAVPALIAIGSTLQAAWGRWLLGRFDCLPLVLDNERSMLRFTQLAGVLAPLIGATVGVATLSFSGRLPAAGVLDTWTTWWVGDSIGVLLVTPMSLMLIGRPRSFWRPQLRRVAPLLLLTLGMVIAAFVVSSRWETQRLNHEFDNRSNALYEQLAHELDRSRDTLAAAERFVASSTELTRTDFRDFVARLAPGKVPLNALEWVPEVPSAALQAHLQEMRAQDMPDYQVWKLGPGNERLVVSPSEDEQAQYFPVAYAEPMSRHAEIIGLDLGSEHNRRDAVLRAMASNEFTVTGRIRLVQDSGDGGAVLALMAVAGAKRSGSLPGGELVVAVLNMPATVAQAWISSDLEGLALRIEDLDALPGQPPLYSNRMVAAGNALFERQKIFDYGGRSWQLSVSATPEHLASLRSWQGWFVLVGGLLFTVLLGALLLLAGGRTLRVERLVAERSEALQRSERINNAVTEASPDAVLLADTEGVVSSANAAAHQILDARRGDLVGCSLTEWLSGREVVVWLRNQEARAGVLRCESIAHSRSGLEIPVELTLTLVTTERYTAISCLMRDLRARDELVRMKNEFISVVNHELRTPLTSLRGSIGLLNGGAVGELPSQAAKLLAMAGQNADRLAQLINDLLDFEKAEFGGVNVDLERQMLPPLIEQVIAEMAGYAQANDVRIDFEFAPGLPAVAVAADRFAQVLGNLLSNAIKFSAAGARVHVRLVQLGDWLRVEIIDQGSGIPSALQSQVFSKFWQADSSARRRHSGTGLGLAIAKHLTERMHGEIGFASQSGKGSSFWVQFPVAKIDAAKPSSDAQARSS